VPPGSHVADANYNAVDHVAGVSIVDTVMALIGVSSVGLQPHENTVSSMPSLLNAEHMSMTPYVDCRKGLKSTAVFRPVWVRKVPSEVRYKKSAFRAETNTPILYLCEVSGNTRTFVRYWEYQLA
jgi:hypothetical protein